jgi:hypothetical protein
MRILVQGKMSGLYLARSGERTDKISEAQTFASGSKARAMAQTHNHEPDQILYDFSDVSLDATLFNFTIEF